MNKANVVAVLDTMYSPGCHGRRAPRWFKINSRNHSGRRLYKMLGDDASLVVTNACKTMGAEPGHHNTPDPEWLADNLTRLIEIGLADIILVCGKVAQETFMKASLSVNVASDSRVFVMKHPAARTWTKHDLNIATMAIQRLIWEVLTEE